MLNPLAQIDQLLKTNQNSKAIKLARKHLKHPQFGLGAHQLCAKAMFQNNERPNALHLLKKALRKWPNNSYLLQDLGHFCYLDNRHNDALSYFQALSKQNPDDSMVLSNIASCHLALHNLEAAYKAARQSVDLPNPHINGFNTLAIVCTQLKKVEEAEDAFLQVIKRNQGDIRQIHNFLIFCETHNRRESARKLLKDLPNTAKNHPLILARIAVLERKDKNFEAAESHLRQAIQTPHAFSSTQFPTCLFELGHILSDQNNQNEAFEFFEKANQLALQDFQAIPTESPFRDLKEQTDVLFEPSEIERNPVFVLGFPRSGTTLIDQVLSTDTDVQCFEETSVITEIYRKARRMSEGGKPLSRDRFQQDYFALYENELDYNSQKLLIDRSAPNIFLTLFIRNLFPKAKIVILHRHPLDMVLSCFMQNFVLNYQNIEFCDLDRTSDLLIQTYAQFDKTDLNAFHLRYEDIVSDFDNTTRALFNHLGLTWTADTANFRQHARQKDRIYTASYHQVTQPLYAAAIDRWKNYRGFLEPQQEKLRPLCEKWGYSLD